MEQITKPDTIQKSLTYIAPSAYSSIMFKKVIQRSYSKKFIQSKDV